MSSSLISVLRFFRPYLFSRHKPRRLKLPAGGNLIAEARRLNRAGFCVAAVLTTRVAVERMLKSLAFSHPDWERRGRRPGLGACRGFLFRVGVLTQQMSRAIARFGERANSVAHGGPVNRWRARSIIEQGAKVLVMLEGGAA